MTSASAAASPRRREPLRKFPHKQNQTQQQSRGKAEKQRKERRLPRG